MAGMKESPSPQFKAVTPWIDARASTSMSAWGAFSPRVAGYSGTATIETAAWFSVDGSVFDPAWPDLTAGGEWTELTLRRSE